MTKREDFEALPDLTARSLGGSVVAANDETFAEKENLIKAAEPRFSASTFGNKGQIMDGWETRRRRESGHDWAIVRLGVPGVIRGVVVDTAYFTGNFPPEASVDAACLDTLGVLPDPAELGKVEWVEIVSRSPLRGDARQAFDVSSQHRFSHVRLNIFPDGGVARLRVHGEPVGDPRWVAGESFDLAAIEHGARVTDASNRFYAAPDNVLMPGPARVMGEGWETARRRDDGNDWLVVALATEGVVRRLEVDTRCFIGNAPGWAQVTGRCGDGPWVELFAADADAQGHGAPFRAGRCGRPGRASARHLSRWRSCAVPRARVADPSGPGTAVRPLVRPAHGGRRRRSAHRLCGRIKRMGGRARCATPAGERAGGHRRCHRCG